MKVYESLEEIEQDLRIYDLERKIAEEEAKAVGLELKSGFIPNSFRKTILRFIGKYGLILALKKLIR